MNPELERAMRREARPVAPTLEKIRDLVRQKRDFDARVADLEEELTQLRQRCHDIERNQLPDLFAAAGISEISIAAAGNMPACQAKLMDYYRANIAANWDQERRQAAFEVLDKLGLSGLLKNTVSVQFNRDEYRKALEVMKMLSAKGMAAQLTKSVAWQTLTAAIRELCESGRRPSQGDLDSLGADVGRVVRLKEKESS